MAAVARLASPGPGRRRCAYSGGEVASHGISRSSLPSGGQPPLLCVKLLSTSKHFTIITSLKMCNVTPTMLFSVYV